MPTLALDLPMQPRTRMLLVFNYSSSRPDKKTAVSIHVRVFKCISTIVGQVTSRKMAIVEILSSEIVKPSSPTPQHLRTFNLSVLHQLVPTAYVTSIIYYPSQDGDTNLEIHERHKQLKRSLSETLTHFYPLAGTIKDDFSIDCDDVGAYYAVARVHTSLTEFLKHLDLDLINRFLPCDPTFNGPSVGIRVTNVQVNIFKCGGFAIGLCISHKILDAAALATFLKCWAALQRITTLSTRNSIRCKKPEEVVYPDLTAPFLPANDSQLRDLSMAIWGSLIKIGKCSTRRFVFDRSAIATLKSEAARNGVQYPTRVEVVSALLWKCAMAASSKICGFTKTSLLTHAVNLRQRSGSSLSENSIENLVWLASAESGTVTDLGLHDLVNQVRGSILEINSEFVTKLQGEKGPQVMNESLERMKDCGKKNVDYIGFTSWCKMGFYEVDFGWGKPIWVCSNVAHGSPMFTDFVFLMDTRHGDGIEAWVNMDEQKMCILEHDSELLAFTSLDPSPLPKSYWRLIL